MAVVCIFCDFEVGHLFPSFGLADMIQRDGHQVVFLILKDMEKYLLETNFSFKIVFQDVYPEGAIKKKESLRPLEGDVGQKQHLLPLLDGALDKTLIELQPDLLLIDYSLSFDSLIIQYKYALKQIIFCTHLREIEYSPEAICMASLMGPGDAPNAFLDFIYQKPENIILRDLNSIVLPMTKIPELILCPKEFDFIDKDYQSQTVHYIGPCIWKSIDQSTSPISTSRLRKLIFVSFGSQVSLYPKEFIKVIQGLLDVLRLEEFSCFDMIVALGDFISQEKFTDVPANVKLLKWIDQISLIQNSAVVITHGGLGTIKECLYHGIPMVVVPMTRDQPSNALRVETHKLGKKIELEMMNTEVLRETILFVLENEIIDKALIKMKKIFREYDAMRVGLSLVNDIIQRD